MIPLLHIASPNGVGGRHQPTFLQYEGPVNIAQIAETDATLLRTQTKLTPTHPMLPFAVIDRAAKEVRNDGFNLLNASFRNQCGREQVYVDGGEDMFGEDEPTSIGKELGVPTFGSLMYPINDVLEMSNRSFPGANGDPPNR